MKKLIVALLLASTCLASAAPLQKYQSGFRTIDGNQLNAMVDVVNNLTGNGTAQPITGTTGTFSSTLGVTGATTLAGGLTLTGTTAASGITCATFSTGVALAANTDQVFFVATRAFRVVAISQIHAVAAGGTSTLQVTKDASTNAPGAGTDLLSAAFNLNATANTVQAGTLVSTAGVTSLAAGDRLAVDFADAVQSTAGVAVTACMAPI